MNGAALTYVADIDDGAYAAVLADSLREVTAELRTIDPVDLLSFIRFGSYPAIEDLIQSSVELFFKHGTLISAWSAGAELAWDSLPLVTLGLEFRHPVVSVFFDLLLGASEGDVTVRGLVFEAPVADRDDGLVLLARALAEARVPRRAASRTGLGGRAASPATRLLPR